MSNLLQETLEDMKRAGQTPEDVIYIGSRDGYACTWDEYTRLADVEYDEGYGSQKVAGDLEIHFRNGDWLGRDEYDGSEGWTYRRMFVAPTETKPIKRLVVDDQRRYSSSHDLAGLHEDDE